ncbi:MAG: D-alanine--D-alanine ligase family protein, partial [Patescibacteria group bacterium]
PFKIPKNGKFDLNIVKKFDVVFPVLHGPYGEDGTIQGICKFVNVPFVGAGVLGSAVGMDKEIMKRLFKEAEIPTPKFLIFHKDDKISYKEVSKKLGKIVFIKPANMGSSVGINKAKNAKEFINAVRDAFRYDFKIIIEENISGQEIECSVLGNEKPVASNPGEILPSDEFYSYDAKYITESETLLKARISKKTREEIRKLAVAAYKTLGCEGMARVDFLLRKSGRIMVNEINTIPGFTNISMYPKMWEASGLSQTKLLDKLIDLAIDRFKKEQKLKTTFK